MEQNSKPKITITKLCPLIIEDGEYCREYASVTMKQGGYILITADCSFCMDKLIKEDSGTGEADPDIIVKGNDGKDGKPGEDGGDAGTGAKAEIKILDLQSSLLVHAYGGGNGGNGGNGGRGGNGGDGASGAHGGNGGDGGAGGNGGNGGAGGKLTISYNTSNGSEITYKELTSKGGKRGNGGEGGLGGAGKGTSKPGEPGDDGAPGQDGGKGSVIINKL
jgi:hypothetical protein